MGLGEKLAKADALAEKGVRLNNSNEEASRDAHKEAEEIYREISEENSFISKHNWYRTGRDETAEILRLKYQTMFFGHDPEAFGENGRIAVTEDGLFVKLDAGMTVEQDETNEKTESKKDVDEKGKIRKHTGGKIMRCPVSSPLSVMGRDDPACFQRGPTSSEFRLTVTR